MSSGAAVEAFHLVVTVRASGRRILDGVDLVLGGGRVVGVIGESGSGKSTLVRCLLGAVPSGVAATGRVQVTGSDGRPVDVLQAPPAVVRSVRSATIAFLGQHPQQALTPTLRVGAAVAERLRPAPGRRRRDDDVAALFESVHLPSDRAFLRRYPHELSGGQAQRVALARALASEPSVLLLDEPTTGLDVLTQARVLDEIERQQRSAPRAVLLVSHDLAVVARLADEVVVMREGRIVEAGRRDDVLRRPAHGYTRTLLAACPDPAVTARSPVRTEQQRGAAVPVLEVAGLHATHPIDRRRSVAAAAGIDLALHRGECVALVGASGAGKSTLARTIVGAHVPDAGTVRLHGRALAAALRDRRQDERWRIQLIPQDPGGSLTPRRTVGASVADVVRRRRPDADAAAESWRLLAAVGLDPGAVAGRRPGTLSGGERQRVAIARALAAEPDVLICDEVTSALDVSVQAGVLDLLRALVDERALSILFVTHDLGVVARVADRVSVLDQGVVCEHGTVADVLQRPQHEISRRLLAASPSLARELAGPLGNDAP